MRQKGKKSLRLRKGNSCSCKLDRLKRIWSILGLGIIIAIVSPDHLLAAKSQKGSTVYVTLQGGGLVSGELLAVKEASLVVYQKATDQGLVIDISRIAFIKVDRKTQVGIGALVGAVIGTMPLAIRFVTGNIGHEFSEYSFLYYLPTVMAAGVGALIGCLFSFDIQVELQGKSPGEIKNILDELQRYAREPRPIPRQATSPSAEKAGEATDRNPPGLQTPTQDKPTRSIWKRFHFLWLPGALQGVKNEYEGDPGSFPPAIIQPGNVSISPSWADFYPEQIKLGSAFVERVRLEYSLNKRLNLGVEYKGLGIWDIMYSLYWEFLEGDNKAHGDSLIGNNIKAGVLLLGLYWRTDTDYLLKNTSIQLGVGAGFSSSKIYTYAISPIPPNQTRTLNKVSPVWQICGGYDYFFSRQFSIGMDFVYYHIPVYLPSFQATGSVLYEMDDPNKPGREITFTRTTTVTMPEQRINLGRFGYFVRIGIHL